jgi:hypothetical protein
VGCKATRRRAEADSIVESYSVTSKRKETTLTSGPGVAATQREKRRARRLRLRQLGRPVYDAREGSWVRGLLKPNGPNAEEGNSRPSGQKLRKEKASISFSFSNIPIAFSNGF